MSVSKSESLIEQFLRAEPGNLFSASEEIPVSLGAGSRSDATETLGFGGSDLVGSNRNVSSVTNVVVRSSDCLPGGSYIQRVEVARALAVASAASPLVCNTGGQSALSGKNELNGALIDWMSFTYHPEQPSQVEPLLEHLKAVLGSEWVDHEYGLLRYGKHSRCGGIRIMWDGTEDMGVHVQVSGQGCRELESRGLTDWREWSAVRLSEGADFVRVDVAFDEKEGLISVDRIEQAFHDGLVSCKFGKFEPVRVYGADGELTARGFNFGNRKNGKYIRSYDKALEQRQKAGLTMDKQEALEKFWTRVEVEYKGDEADCLVRQFVADGPEVLAGSLRKTLDIKERGEAVQRCRWDTAKWWGDFLAWAEKVRLILDPDVKTLDRTFRWLGQAVATSLALAKLTVSDFTEFIEGLAESGMTRFRPVHLNMLSAYYVRE